MMLSTTSRQKQIPSSQCKNLGYFTDAIFHRRDGEVTDRGDYYLIRTPSNPTYFWGNFLLFKSAPTKGCFDRWMTINQAEFGPNPAHIAFGWDSDQKGDPSEFEANITCQAGFKIDKVEV
jgi:hypothetical protein